MSLKGVMYFVSMFCQRQKLISEYVYCPPLINKKTCMGNTREVYFVQPVLLGIS